jgi:hypothetical protein
MTDDEPMDPVRLHVHAAANGIAIEGIDATVAYCLHQVPDLLRQRESPETRRRFYPDVLPSDDPRNAEWHRLMDADLHHLFESAAEVLTRDLASLEITRGRLVFAASHASAWMSALNQARIVLSEQHRLDQRDMERTDLDAVSPRDRALLQVHVLGLVLQLLVEHTLDGMS